MAASLALLLSGPQLTAETARAIPAPSLDVPRSSESTSDMVVLAGGCFWGVQGVFQHVKGVTNAVSGYAGGGEKTAHYDIVGRGMTGHAESVEVTFDPRQISLGRILQVYFSVAHDPTQLNRQGPDMGTQYRISWSNPTHPYIEFHDLPKIEELKRVFPDLYRNEPVLVARAGQSN